MKALKLTPNLVVRDVTASLDFLSQCTWIRTCLQCSRRIHRMYLPHAAADGVEIFFNDKNVVAEDYPALATTSAAASRCLLKWTI